MTFHFVTTTGDVDGLNTNYVLPSVPNPAYPVILIGGFGMLTEDGDNEFQFERSGTTCFLGPNVPVPQPGDPQPKAFYAQS